MAEELEPNDINNHNIIIGGCILIFFIVFICSILFFMSFPSSDTTPECNLCSNDCNCTNSIYISSNSIFKQKSDEVLNWGYENYIGCNYDSEYFEVLTDEKGGVSVQFKKNGSVQICTKIVFSTKDDHIELYKYSSSSKDLIWTFTPTTTGTQDIKFEINNVEVGQYINFVNNSDTEVEVLNSSFWSIKYM